MSEKFNQNPCFQRVVVDLQLLNRLAYCYGLKGVLKQVSGYTDQLFDASLNGNESLLCSAVKLASRAVPNMAAVLMYYVAKDARDGVLGSEPHALKKIHRETMLALSALL